MGLPTLPPGGAGGSGIALRRALTVLVATLAVLSVASLAGAAGEGGLEASLTTEQPIDLSGNLSLEGTGGAHLQELRSEHTVTIEAEKITARTGWTEGTKVASDDPIRVGTAVTTYQANETTNLTDVRMTIDTWKPGTELLLAPDSNASLKAAGAGDSTLDPLASGSLLAEAFYSEEGSVGPSDLPQYTYRTGTPLGALGALDTLEARGNATLFANNATLEAVAEEGEWSDWTGLRVTDRTGPKEDYEVRVTVLHLEGARVSLEAPDSITALASQPSIALSGSMATSSARGTISTPAGVLDLEDERTRFTGEGRVNATALGADRGPGEAGLSTTIEGDFEVPSAKLAPASRAEPGEGLPVATLGLPVVGTLLAGLLLVGLRRAHPWVGTLPAALREPLWERYRARAAGHEDAQAPEAAARCYETMTALRPDHPTGWYGAAVNRLEAGEPAAAVALVGRSREHLGHVPLDLLELQVAGAAKEGDFDEASRALADLAEASPRKARSLVAELDLDELRGSPGLGDGPGGTDGGWPSA